jgi:hypothetical protein
MPEGTVGGTVSYVCSARVRPSFSLGAAEVLEVGRAKRTLSVVMEVDELVVPLRYYSERILQEGHHD